MKVSKSSQREIPRPFKFHWGEGYVTEEVSVKCSIDENSWEPTIQLLEYEDGTQQLRFCVYDGRRFNRMPLIMGMQEMNALAKLVEKSRGIKNLLPILVK